jgi:hypothetical protein
MTCVLHQHMNTYQGKNSGVDERDGRVEI